MSLSPQFLDELRHRTSLSALIGRSTKLQKAGHEFRACCPFHNEKTPSFYVNDDKGFYHCFGCSAHGDAIRWMTDQRGLSFIDAVRELADGAGMELPAIDRASAQQSEQARGIHDACAAAAAWFGDQLGAPGGAAARAMLDARGITAASITTFGLGFAPDARGRLRGALSKLGDALLIESGLLIAGRADAADQSPYDRFRGRIMIPIRDPRGRPIAFGGRVITSGGSGGADGGATAEPGAKYLNSPESPLFSKGQTLFNLDLAAPAARRRGRVIVVEGYLDVIALAQAGIAEVVAPLGTALTETQLEMLWRMSDVPLLCFDGDAAGRKAGLRAAHRALAMLAPGRSLALVMLPPGRDPDDIVRNGGAAAIEAIIAAAEPLVDRLWNEQLASAPLATPEQRAGLRQRLTELAQTIGDASVRSEYLAEFRRRLDGLRPQPVAVAPFRRRDVRAGGWNIPPAPVTEAAKSVGAGGIDRILAKAVLAGLIRHPGEIGRHVEVLSQLKLADDALGRLFGAVVDLALEDQALDHTRLRTILAGSGFDALATELLRADQLSFSFTINDTEPRRAHEDLDEAIAILVARPEVDAALAAATLALQTVGRDPIELPGQTPAPAAGRTIDEAFARQVALVREQQALAARLANLVQANEDARSDEIEGR